MKKCPFCAEEIQDEAIKCKHCGGVLVSDDWRAFSDRYRKMSAKQKKKEFEALTADQKKNFRAAWSALEYDKPRATPASRENKKSARSASCFILVIAVLVLFGLMMWCSQKLSEMGSLGSGGSTHQQNQAQAALSYLETEVSEIRWLDFDSNHLHIGFDPIPGDLCTIIGAAAFRGNRAINFGYHVWAVDAARASKGWRPGDPGLICNATARYGKAKNNSCC